MEFTVRKYDILREIGLTQGVVEKKNTIPILANVLIDADGDHIQISATDLELGIKCTCPAKIKATTPAKNFLDIIRALPDDDIMLSL
jgi:DNA polymerase-3 subunit beta